MATRRRPASSTLVALHEIIRWRWDGVTRTLFEFRIGDKVYGEPDPDDILYERKVYRAKGLRLKSLIDSGVDRFEYVYDFGDNWIHDIIIEGVRRDGEADVAFVDGARRGPPEDVGGRNGFMEFLEAVLEPRHEGHDRMLEWYGKPFDPFDIDEKHVRRILSCFADRRRGPLASHRNGSRRKAS